MERKRNYIHKNGTETTFGFSLFLINLKCQIFRLDSYMIKWVNKEGHGV